MDAPSRVDAAVTVDEGFGERDGRQAEVPREARVRRQLVLQPRAPPGAWADRPIAASRPELWIGPAVASPF